MKFNVGVRAIRFASWALMVSQSAMAQHNHGRRNTVELEYESIPSHDEVLELAPEDLVLRFNEYVRLVKFTLKVEDREMLDINFNFALNANKVFIQPIPALKSADYYTAEWAVLNADSVLVFGYFCFSFGANARVPTTIINARQFPASPF